MASAEPRWLLSCPRSLLEARTPRRWPHNHRPRNHRAHNQLAHNQGTQPAGTQPAGTQSVPGLAGLPHFAPRAKRIIHLFMAGAPSHLELFDYKPKLFELAGKPLPPEVIRGQRYAFIRPDSAVLEPQFAFRQATSMGMQISDAMPHLRDLAERLCFVRSMHTDQFNHAPAQIFFNSGFAQPGRPSLGSWLVYGLGCDTQELPAFVVMSTGAGISGGAANWSSGFLPTRYAGTRLRSGSEPILNINNPPGIDPQLQRSSIDAIARMNSRRLEEVADPEIHSRIAAYELAFRLQTTAPELMQLDGETRETLDLYGCQPDKPNFARGCLLARRMIERGVRMVTLYNEGWDAHSDVKGNHTRNCRETDRACAALVLDLERRGLLEDTLVVWGGEFGRTPMVESNPTLGRKLGRDHHPQAFTVWMAGGGVQPGMVWGQTDELGFHVVENPVHIHDLQATIMHLMGIDHERLTYFHQGREFRLTDVHGQVVSALIA
jgi:hypothetical protein